MAPTAFPRDMHTSKSLHEAVVYVMDGKDSACSLPASIAFMALQVGSTAEAALSDKQKALLTRPGEDPYIPGCLPRMSITGYGYSTSDLGICSITKNQHMCDHCGALGKDLSRCVRCQHAHYCGKACQKAAWRGHKATCKQLCEELEERERVRGRRLFYHDVYLVDILHPDKLLQCRFWFKMLLSTLWTRESESNWEGRYIALRHLIRFLWLYTGLPLGHGLLLMLQRAVDDVRNALRREPPSNPTLARDVTLAADTLFYAMLHDEASCALVLEGLPILHAQRGWPHDKGREAELRGMLLHVFKVQRVGYERNTFWGPVMRPEVAKLQVAIAPRAIGLMGTAFARLHRGDEGGGGGGGGCQELVSLLLLQWLCKPWSAADEVTQRCIVAGITLLERQPDIDTSGMNARALAGAQEAARGLPADVAQRYLRAASARIEFACEPPLADAARLKGLQGSVRSLLRPNKEPCGNRVVMSSTIHLSPPVLRCVADPVTHLPASMRDMFTPMEAFGAGGGMLAKKLMHAFAEAAEGRGPGRPLYPICEAYVLHEVDLGPPPRTPQAVAKVFG